MLNKLILQPSSLSVIERYELKYNVISVNADCFNDRNFMILLYSRVDEISSLLSYPIIKVHEKISKNTFTKEEKNKIIGYLRK